MSLSCDTMRDETSAFRLKYLQSGLAGRLFMNYYYESPIGKLFITFEGKRLSGIHFEGEKHFPADIDVIKATSLLEANNAKTLGLSEWLDAYFNKEKPELPNLLLAPEGTDFQQLVWKELLFIPYGKTVSYGDIAKALAKKGRPTSARAVGSAVGRNPISILIPCHRVIGADGKLTGYAGGLDRKIALLRLEGIISGDGLIA